MSDQATGQEKKGRPIGEITGGLIWLRDAQDIDGPDGGYLLDPEDRALLADAVNALEAAEHQATEQKARAEESETEAKVLRSALYECAKASGEDVSDGPPTWPPIGEWALRAVQELRHDYDECPAPEDLQAAEARATELGERLARVREWAAKLEACEVEQEDMDELASLLTPSTTEGPTEREYRCRDCGWSYTGEVEYERCGNCGNRDLKYRSRVLPTDGHGPDSENPILCKCGKVLARCDPTEGQGEGEA